MANRARFRILLLIVAVLGALVALIWALSKRSPIDRTGVVTSTATENSHAVSSNADRTTEAHPSPSPTGQPSPAASVSSAGLLIPVAGVRPDELRDTFQEARSEGRIHDAIDIPAPRGTPVLAAIDGRIIKLFQSERGGTTIYQLGPDNGTVYYYAHLERYADGITEGRTVRRGEVIAYVGDTGNAGAGNYHLHFAILIVSDPKRYWDGTNINPYPLLHNTQ